MKFLVPIVVVFAISFFTTRRYFSRVSAEKRSRLLRVATLSVAFTFAFIASRGHAGAWPLAICFAIIAWQSKAGQPSIAG
jgi:hypothetical protein